jgi:pyruvate kinase
VGITTDIDLLEHRRTKIVATLGPASSSPEIIRKLLLAGANVIRLNMSHGDYGTHQRTYAEVRRIAEDLGQQIAIFADLCGPKVRVGKFETGQIDLRDGETVVVTTRDIVGRHGLIPSQYESLAVEVGISSRIMLNDGAVELRVESIDGSEISCTVVHGGPLKNHKGMNLPGTDVSAPALTDKDRDDARFALGLGVDYLALSFVRSADDVQQLRALIDSCGPGSDTGIIAKIERPEATSESS